MSSMSNLDPAHPGLVESTKVPLLDHGYVALVESHGSDERIIEAARMSVDKGFLGWGPDEDGKPGDERLLRFLYEHKHTTPFEMAGFTIEVKAPIFVLRQWHRHRTQSYNEMSARYTPLPAEDYLPSVERLLRMSDKNKQAGAVKGADVATARAADHFREALKGSYKRQEDLYQQALRDGMPKELARLGLPVARYTRMRASANLKNWLGFLTLRCDSHAQEEIRVYADAIADTIVAKLYPRTFELWSEGVDRA